MTNTRIVFISIVISILLAVLVLWCADVLAHSDGNPSAHFEPYTTQDPCWDSSCKDAAYRNGHGHIDRYEDDNSNGRWDLGEENSWGYWRCEGYKYLFPETDCSEPAETRGRGSEEARERGSESRSEDPDKSGEAREREDSSVTEPEAIAVVLDRIIEDEPEPSADIEIPEPPPPPVEPPQLERWEWQFRKGWNFVSFPVLPVGVETVSDLYHHWTFFAAHSADIVMNLDGEWLLYSGVNDGIAGEIPLSAHLGLAVQLDWASWLGVSGVPLPNAGTIDLRPGVNLVGFPDLPPGVSRPSDLLSEVICAVMVTRRGELYLVGRVGDSGDEPLERGQAVILIATQPTTLELKPSTELNGQSLRGWGAEKVGP